MIISILDRDNFVNPNKERQRRLFASRGPIPQRKTQTLSSKAFKDVLDQHFLKVFEETDFVPLFDPFTMEQEHREQILEEVTAKLKTRLTEALALKSRPAQFVPPTRRGRSRHRSPSRRRTGHKNFPRPKWLHNWKPPGPSAPLTNWTIDPWHLST
jgi:hypothetical protein